MGDFLEAYQAKFDLPVHSGVRVLRVSTQGSRYLVACSEGSSYLCDNVVVATGTFGRTPNIPTFAAELDQEIRQLHSSDYKRASQLRPGPVLVVGAVHSGSDIAYEVAGNPVILSGTIRGEVPFRPEKMPAKVGFPLLYFVATHVLTIRTPIGRRVRTEIRLHGGPLIRVKRADLARVGVEMVPARTVAAKGGAPVLAPDRSIDVTNVVWCSGFRQDFSWIDLPVTAPDGWPSERRGIVASAPGLYFVGLAFQYAFSSNLVGGAGRDAEYVVKHLDGRLTKARRPQAPTVA